MIEERDFPDGFAMVGKFIDPKSDWGFKKLFGTEENKQLLIDFLNVTFPDRHIVDLEYMNSENLGFTPSSKAPVFDVICRTDDGGVFVVEMQRYRQENFVERMFYYLAAVILRLKKGRSLVKDKYGEYVLPETRILAILDFNLFECEKYFSGFHLAEDEEGWLLSGKIGLYFIELQKFQKSSSELCSLFEKWLYLLNNMNGMDGRPEGLRDEAFDLVFDVAAINSLSIDDRQLYETCMMNEQDYINAKNYAVKLARQEGLAEGHEHGRQEGLAEGHEHGRQEGLAEGLSEGLAKGKQEGLAEGHEHGMKEGLAKGKQEGLAEGQAELERQKLASLKAMLSNNVPEKDILLYLNLTAGELDKLKKSL